MRDCVHLLMTMTAGSPLSMATRMRLVSFRSGSRRPRSVQLWWTSWASSLVSLGPLWPLVSLSFSLEGFHKHPRQERVRQVREGENVGQMGHGRESNFQASNFNIQKSNICWKINKILN